MANAAKPGADLLWAFQLHREHGALSKRLTLLEKATAQQQDRTTAEEQSARAAYDQRLDALARQLQTLQESEVTEQVAGLASELRATRQQVDQAREKVKSIESASKEIDGKIQEREQVVHAKLGSLESTLAQVQRTLLGFEGRLQFAAQHGARVAAEGLEESGQRHREEIVELSERLRGLQDVQNEMRALVEGVVRDWHKAPAFAHSLEQTTAAPLSAAPTSYPHHGTAALHRTTAAPFNAATASHATTRPNPQQEKPVLDQTTAAPPSTSAAPHITTVPNAKSGKAKANTANAPVKKKRFEKEIASLINGEGSLTNAPDIMQSQQAREISRGAGKKRKVPAEEGPLLRLAFTQHETRSQFKKVKEEPLATRAKVPAKTSRKAVAEAKPAGKKGTTRQAANITTTRVKKEPERNLRSARSPTPERPSPLPSSDEIQVAVSQEVVRSPTPTPLPLASRGKGKGKAKVVVKREQQTQPQPQPRRRRIKQDDSMEEFLAKCRASTGGPGGGGSGD
jgi:hypothetical protein